MIRWLLCTEAIEGVLGLPVYVKQVAVVDKVRNQGDCRRQIAEAQPTNNHQPQQNPRVSDVPLAHRLPPKELEFILAHLLPLS